MPLLLEFACSRTNCLWSSVVSYLHQFSKFVWLPLRCVKFLSVRSLVSALSGSLICYTVQHLLFFARVMYLISWCSSVKDYSGCTWKHDFVWWSTRSRMDTRLIFQQDVRQCLFSHISVIVESLFQGSIERLSQCIRLSMARSCPSSLNSPFAQ